jgi:hypothetical protein
MVGASIPELQPSEQRRSVGQTATEPSPGVLLGSFEELGMESLVQAD